jgi:hypothetical protein
VQPEALKIESSGAPVQVVYQKKGPTKQWPSQVCQVRENEREWLYQKRKKIQTAGYVQEDDLHLIQQLVFCWLETLQLNYLWEAAHRRTHFQHLQQRCAEQHQRSAIR